MLTGCQKVEPLSEAFGWIKTLTELHADRNAITKLLSFASLSFGGQGRIQPKWWTFGLLSKQQHPQRPISFASLHMLKSLNFSYCNLVQVPESIGGLSFLNNLNLEGNNLLEVPKSIGGLSYLKVLYLGGNNLLEVPESIGGLSSLKELNLEGNNFTSLPGSLNQLSHLQRLKLNGCKKLEVLPELPFNLDYINAADCTSLREVSGAFKYSSKHRDRNFSNCPKVFKNVTIDSVGNLSITSQGFIHYLSAFLGYYGLQTNNIEFIGNSRLDHYGLDIAYHGNSIPEWFTNRSRENHVKVDLPSDWDMFKGYATCVVLNCKKASKLRGFSVKIFNGASLIAKSDIPYVIKDFLKKEVIGIQDSYMIWLHYERAKNIALGWKKAKNFVTVSLEENNEDFEVKESGVRLIGDVSNLTMFHDLPTLSQHGGAICLTGTNGRNTWSW
ncbi:NB-ARC domains-containing protein [Tanacetum coccineum]